MPSKRSKRKANQAILAISTLKPARPPPLPPKVDLAPQARLDRIITVLLGGPRGDPDQHHCLAAAHALILARQLGMPVEDLAEVEQDLRESIRPRLHRPR